MRHVGLGGLRDVAGNLLWGLMKILQQSPVVDCSFFGGVHRVNDYLGSLLEIFKFLLLQLFFFGHELDLLHALQQLLVCIFE
jgi:hypothetical protein